MAPVPHKRAALSLLKLEPERSYNTGMNRRSHNTVMNKAIALWNAACKTIYQELNFSWHGTVAPGTQTWRLKSFSSDGPAIAVVVLAVAAVLMWLSAKGFVLGTHFDEPFKVQSVLMGSITFYHPLLMLHLVRAANAVMGLTDPQSVVELGRTCAAVAGGALIVATFALGRLVLPAWTAVAAAAAMLATPLISVHARYLKEDIFVAPFVVLALAGLITVLRTPTLGRTIALGAIIGLAAGSKYVGGLLLLPYALVVMISSSCNNAQIRARLTRAGIAALTAGCVFVIIEVPALLHPNNFFTEVRSESLHAMEGNSIRLPVTLTWGTFHLRESLWPGLGPPLTILGMVGLAAPFFASSKRRQPLAVIAGFAFVWYLAHEISPLKPYPDFARYMVPLVPLLMILAAAFINEWAERYRTGTGAAVATVVLLAAAVPASWLSFRINVRAFDDPRRLLPEIVANAPRRIIIDSYAGNYPSAPVALRDPLPTATILVTSSFNYERYVLWGMSPQEPVRTQEVAEFFVQALALPRIDLSNGQPSFGFFNPTTSIIAMDGNAERLVPIAELIARVAPTVVVRWNVPRPTPR